MVPSDIRFIPLTKGYVAIVDADDYERLAQYKWQVSKARNNLYAARKQGGMTIKMHRQILNAPRHLYCDHINHNGLDNRKCNLRLCTPAQNTYNKRPLPNSTSKYKGVSWDRKARKWQAEIRHHSRTIHIGYFEYELDDAIAYDDYAIELFGEFAYLNHQHRPEIRQWMHQSWLLQPT